MALELAHGTISKLWTKKSGIVLFSVIIIINIFNIVSIIPYYFFLFISIVSLLIYRTGNIYLYY